MGEGHEEKKTFSRRDLLKTTGLVGAGMAVSNAVTGRDQVEAFQNIAPPVISNNIWEVLYEVDSGIILACAENNDGMPKLPTDPEIQTTRAFLNIDMVDFEKILRLKMV